MNDSTLILDEHKLNTLAELITKKSMDTVRKNLDLFKK